MDDLKLEKVIYKYKDKEVELKVDYDDKEIYLTAKDMSKLFDKDESNIRKIIVGLKEKNRYKNSYLNIKNSPVQVNFTYTEHIIELTASDGKIYKNVIYNSSVIFALGLKFKSEIVMDLKEFMDGLFKENSSVLKCNLSLNSANNYEIVKYDNGEITISINVDYNEETVWLTQEEISSLFLVSKSTISYHISNIFNGKELDFNSVVRKIRTTGKDDKNYEMIYYNLDLILAVGYRVNSKRGIEFRRWASSIIKQHLLKGYSINEKRCLECSESIISLNNRVRELEMKSQKYNELLFGKNYELIIKGDIPSSIKTFDRIVNLSTNNIKIIDRYIDDSVINFLEKYPNKSFIIYTSNKQLNDLKTNNITIKYGCNCHSRYIIVDDKYYYVYTCSLNSLDKNNYDIIFLDGIIIDDIFR